MKTLLVLCALVVGGVKLGCMAFDAGLETVQQSQVAKQLQVRG